jgi:predicted AAA+ superfamily ATPase
MNQIARLQTDPITASNMITRKVVIESAKSLLVGPPSSGKSTLILSTLKQMGVSAYLYLDLADARLNHTTLQEDLDAYVAQEKPEVIVLESFAFQVAIPNASHVIISSETITSVEGFTTYVLHPLDFEEFLAFDHKFDSADQAFSHFIKRGTLPLFFKLDDPMQAKMHQGFFQSRTSPVGYTLLQELAELNTQPVSAHYLYTRLKSKQKISKDKLYAELKQLEERHLIHFVAKLDHPRSAKKVYLYDFKLPSLLGLKKDFTKLFESIVFLELYKRHHQLFYDNNELIIPELDLIVISFAFPSIEGIYKRIEKLHVMTSHIEIITMSEQFDFTIGKTRVDVIPFTQWALLDDDLEA